MELQGKIIGAQFLGDGILLSKISVISRWAQILSIILISVALPALLFLIFQSYALAEGLAIESGCHGPELGFGMLSGILLCLQLRFSSTISNS